MPNRLEALHGQPEHGGASARIRQQIEADPDPQPRAYAGRPASPRHPRWGGLRHAPAAALGAMTFVVYAKEQMAIGTVVARLPGDLLRRPASMSAGPAPAVASVLLRSSTRRIGASHSIVPLPLQRRPLSSRVQYEHFLDIRSTPSIASSIRLATPGCAANTRLVCAFFTHGVLAGVETRPYVYVVTTTGVELGQELILLPNAMMGGFGSTCSCGVHFDLLGYHNNGCHAASTPGTTMGGRAWEGSHGRGRPTAAGCSFLQRICRLHANDAMTYFT